jgi:plastocyanin
VKPASGRLERVWSIALVLLAIPFALEAATWPLSSEAAKPVKHVVAMQGFGFKPAVVEAKVGDTLVWVNRDIVPHAVAATSGKWASGSIATNATWKFVPKSAGKVEYLCPFHPTMKGTLVVH